MTTAVELAWDRDQVKTEVTAKVGSLLEALVSGAEQGVSSRELEQAVGKVVLPLRAVR